ncbi:MAG: hypothetical protein IPP78_00925 [Holophagaceae bacterium]|nr:hypothetical protein [Holophagaceae bacterium]
MKHILFALVAIVSASALQGQIAASPHDLSTTGPRGKTNTTQTCVFCHTPHGAIGSVSSEVAGQPIAAQLIPLWNHSTTATVFTMYNTTNNPISNLQGVVDATVTGASLACLSCHDGVLAVGAISNLPNDVAAITYTAFAGGLDATGHIIGTAKMGVDLTNDHPISITYMNAGNTAPLDPGMKMPSTFAANGVKLFANKVQCASCHDVHNWGTVAAGTRPFLAYTMTASGLCLQCHTK